jgi:Cys-rich protein (TIGR01571 family)
MRLPCCAFALVAFQLRFGVGARSLAATTAGVEQQVVSSGVTSEQFVDAVASRSIPSDNGFLAAGSQKSPERSKWAYRFSRVREFLHESRIWIYNMGYVQLPSWSVWILHVTISWVVFMVLSLLVWIHFYPDDPDLDELFSGREGSDPVKTFTDSRFGCFQAPKICLCACLCPALRWADNVNMAGFMRIPVALGLFFVCGLVNGLTGTFCYSGFITCLMILFYRHKLRAKLGLPSFTSASCCEDFFYVFCCSWCAIAQEARVVRYAYQKGTLSLTTGKRYGKSELPGRPFPRGPSDRARLDRALAPPPQPAPLAAQRLVAEES